MKKYIIILFFSISNLVFSQEKKTGFKFSSIAGGYLHKTYLSETGVLNLNDDIKYYRIGGGDILSLFLKIGISKNKNTDIEFYYFYNSLHIDLPLERHHQFHPVHGIVLDYRKHF